MAQAIPCDFCGAEEASHLLTNLQDGAVTSIGVGCLPQFVGQLAEALGWTVSHPDDADDGDTVDRDKRKWTVEEVGDDSTDSAESVSGDGSMATA